MLTKRIGFGNRFILTQTVGFVGWACNPIHIIRPWKPVDQMGKRTRDAFSIMKNRPVREERMKREKESLYSCGASVCCNLFLYGKGLKKIKAI